ncbi:MAG: hypothetical protein HZB15_14865 [Actinobacteria bacterium]|nr:hypothetical protein [Actinomycetota bacterium]
MKPQRSLAALVVTVGLVGLGLTARDAPAEVDPTFANLGKPTMPFVPSGSFITSSWFCPGVPSGEDDLGGSVEITNPSDEPIDGHITIYSSDTEADVVVQPIEIAARSNLSVDIAAAQPTGAYVSALVEIDGGGGFVEQIARHPAGDAVAPCANAASSSWYFADGFTLGDSTEQLILSNPYPDAAVVTISFVTAAGPRSPSRLKGYPVPGQSVQVVELGSGARDEAVLAAEVQATRGRVVAARAQNYTGGGRAGFSLTLGAPSLSSQYYFADGEVGEGIDERYAIFNPSEQEVTVDAIFLGIDPAVQEQAAADGFVNEAEIVVPAGRVVTLSTSEVPGLPAGRHGASFATYADDSIVVERALTRPAGDGIATTVVMGSPPGLASTRWSAAVGTDIALDNVLVVLNVDGVDTTVTVSALGPGGLVPVPGLEALALPRAGLITVPIEDPSALGRPLVIESGQRIYVERLLARDPDLRGRSGSFALAG